MQACPRRLRRRIAATVLPLLTLASAGTFVARAAENNQNNADLAITKTASPSTVAAGGRVTYTLTVTNNGPRPGTQIRIHDALPSGVDFVSAEVSRKSTPSDSCSRAGNVVDCTIHGNVRPDGSDSVVVTIVGTVNTPSGTTQVCNTASVTGNHDDLDPSNNNTSVACVTIVPPPSRHADLSMTKTADHDRVSIGDDITYTLRVHNNGPDLALNPTVSDVLPAHVQFVSVTPGSPTCAQSGGVVSCTLGPIASGSDALIKIVVRPTDDNGGSTLRNCATVTTIEDAAHGNDTGCVETAVAARADLSIVKTAARTTALVGEPLAYTIKVHNNGPNTASGVVVTDNVPSQAAVQSATASQGSCSTAPHTATGTAVSCPLGSIDSGNDATVTITVAPRVKGMITNTATVTSDTEDRVGANNTSTTSAVAYVALTGGAFGESIDVTTLLGLHVMSGPLASVSLPAGGGGPFADSAVKVRVTDGLFSELVRLDALSASTQGGRTANGNISVASSADVAKASLVNGLITVQGLHSDCLATTDPHATSASSANVVNLRIAGLLVKVAAGPNSSIAVPGVGTLILNEQVSSGTGLNQSRAVNALHLKLDGILAHGDVILAHSDCGIDP